MSVSFPSLPRGAVKISTASRQRWIKRCSRVRCWMGESDMDDLLVRMPRRSANVVPNSGQDRVDRGEQIGTPHGDVGADGHATHVPANREGRAGRSRDGSFGALHFELDEAVAQVELDFSV